MRFLGFGPLFAGQRLGSLTDRHYAIQYIQKFSSADLLPPETGDAAPIGVVGGSLTLGGGLSALQNPDGTFRINSRDFTQATGDSIAAQFTPNQTVTTTGEVFGVQIKPRAAADVDVGGVNGIGLDVEMKDGAADNSGDLRGINLYFGALGTGTISGDVVGIRLRSEIAKTVTGEVVAIEVEDNEAGTDWSHFLKLGAALGTHGMTTNSDKSGQTASGTIKVIAGGTLYHIQLYAD
jgi:hypothetical protein